MGVELGWRRLLLPPPPPPSRLGEEGGGRSGRGGGWVLLCNFSQGAKTRRLQTRRPRRCGGGGTCRHATPPGPKYVCTDPLFFPCPAQPSPASREGVSAVRPQARSRRCGTVSVQSPSPYISDTLGAARPGAGNADHPCGSAAGRAPTPPARLLSPAGALVPRDRATSGVGPKPRSRAEAGRRQREEKLKKLSFPPKDAPRDQVRPFRRSLTFFFPWVGGGEAPRARVGGDRPAAEAIPGRRAAGADRRGRVAGSARRA